MTRPENPHWFSGPGGHPRRLFTPSKISARPRITLAGRNEQRVAGAARRLGLDHASFESLGKGLWEAELIVNTTPVSDPAESPEMAAMVREAGGAPLPLHP